MNDSNSSRKLKLGKKTIKNLNIRSGIATGAPSVSTSIVVTANCPSGSVASTVITSTSKPSSFPSYPSRSIGSLPSVPTSTTDSSYSY